MSGDLGAVWLDENRYRFRVWAPFSKEVHLHMVAPYEKVVRMQGNRGGHHQIILDDVAPGTRYVYRLDDGTELPDPVSRYQPDGVFGPSQVVDPRFEWGDAHWFGLPIENYIIYELHVGTFTSAGTFEAVIPYLDELVRIGITAIELMPVAQFPGTRNWGYDGVFPYAVQNSYGGPGGLKSLVNVCHQRGLAAILDVVYNHIGPEGNGLPKFGPYFSERYKTPWGAALNFDDAHSDEVRRFFISNALEWITDYHLDALRLDAVHAMLDHSALNFLEELAESVHERGTTLNRRVYVIAESALNDTRLIRSTELGGYGLDAQWNDDFHHSLHTLLTKERAGYYVDFGDFQHMAQAFSEGFVYSGHYSVTRGRRHGNSSRGIPSVKFVVYAQNHDQIGNRMWGERLSQLVSFEGLKLASTLVLLSPFIPLLFMGDEYGETAPFLYFVSHSDPRIIEAVRHGRKEEFAAFNWSGEPPDPQDEQTFRTSQLNHPLKHQGRHRVLLEYHAELIRLRKSLPALRCLSKEKMDVVSFEEDRVLAVRRWNGDNEVLAVFNFRDREVRPIENFPFGVWHKRLDSQDTRWMGKGSSCPDVIDTGSGGALVLPPQVAVVFEKEVAE
ncbi:MAG: malto-oligosyltrehalose trehalohydrolase [Acidobacteria bacterium]|nr:MAG: malto-oligosyltrehalose trehalohydrolase [Acidobacteriota bacterium]